MTPEFSPQPTGLPRVPITLAAVGPAMIKLAGRVCDGVRLHGFATRRYLEEVALPNLYDGLEQSGRDRKTFEVWGGGFVATAATEAALAEQAERIRYRVAFYGSTRSYHPVFAVHGWEDLGLKLHAMSKQGRWTEMAAEVPDEVLHTFAAIATHDDLQKTVAERFGGIVDSIALDFDADTGIDQRLDLIQDMRSIPSRFERFPDVW